MAMARITSCTTLPTQRVALHGIAQGTPHSNATIACPREIAPQHVSRVAVRRAPGLPDWRARGACVRRSAAPTGELRLLLPPSPKAQPQRGRLCLEATDPSPAPKISRPGPAGRRMLECRPSRIER